jgi:4-hydroxybenzoate polyprenyltransferase
VRYANFVKLPHTVFALPFALVGVTLASYRAPVSYIAIAWVVLAFTAARFAAMGFNRIVDRAYDAKNPRTAMREIPSGTMGVKEAKLLVIAAILLFEFAAWKLNLLCYMLSPFALAAAVMCWTGGFDILYALQDIDFDRANGLYSLPASVGAPRALMISRVLHFMTIALLALVGYAAGQGALYNIGVAVAAALLVFEHSLVHADDVSRVDKAFFTVNMALSSAFFAFVLAQRIWS